MKIIYTIIVIILFFSNTSLFMRLRICCGRKIEKKVVGVS